MEDRVDRLAPRVLDERAGVHHDEVGLVDRARGLQAVGDEGRDDLVGVDGVLRAAERLEVERRGTGSIDGTGTATSVGLGGRARPYTAAMPDDGFAVLGEWPRLAAQILRARLETAGIAVLIEWSGTDAGAARRARGADRRRRVRRARSSTELDVDDEVPDTSPEAYLARIEEHLSAASELLFELRTRLDEPGSSEREAYGSVPGPDRSGGHPLGPAERRLHEQDQRLLHVASCGGRRRARTGTFAGTGSASRTSRGWCIAAPSNRFTATTNGTPSASK